jgi:hypothetical protein
VLKSGEIGFNLTDGKYKVGDGTTAFSALSYVNALSTEHTSLAGRVATLEGGPIPTPTPGVMQQKFSAISYLSPTSTSNNSYWANLASFAGAQRLGHMIANPENGPGWRSTHTTGSTIAAWTSRLSQVGSGAHRLGYVSVNYSDSESPHSSSSTKGTVGGMWRFVVSDTTNDIITFKFDGTTSTTGGAPGADMPMILPTGTAAMGVKPWDATLSGNLTGTGLAESTSYFLRPTGALPCATYTLHTSQAHAEANTGKVNLTGTGSGPLFMGFRRGSAFAAGVCYEMTAYVERYGTLISGWFFDESSHVDDNAWDTWWDEIIAYRDANHPGLVICVNGIPDDATRAGMYDFMMEENSYANWVGSWLTGSVRCPAYISNGTVPSSKFWGAVNGVDTAQKMATMVALMRTSKIGYVSVVNGSYGSPLSGTGYVEADVVAAVVAGNA